MSLNSTQINSRDIDREFYSFSKNLREGHWIKAFEAIETNQVRFEDRDTAENTVFHRIARVRNCTTLFIQTLGLYERQGGHRRDILDLTNWRQETILHQAAEAQDRALIRYLVKQGLSLFAVNRKGVTPFSLAVMNHFEMMKFLVGFCKKEAIGIPWNLCYQEYVSLHTWQRQQLKGIDFQIEEEFFAQFNAFNSLTKAQCFGFALSKGNFALAEKMMPYFYNEANARVTTPLHQAVLHKNLPFVIELIWNGSFIYARDHRMKTPLDYAQEPIASRLIRYEDEYPVSSTAVNICHSPTVPVRKKVEIRNIMIAGHIWGLSGSFKWEGSEVEFGGMHINDPAVSNFLPFSERFFTTNNVPEIFENIPQFLREVTQSRACDAAAQQAAIAKTGKWVAVDILAPRHAHYLLVRYPFVYLCDRARSEPSTIRGQIRDDLSPRDFFKIFDEIHRCRYLSQSKYLYEERITPKLNPNSISYIPHKQQRFGNCVIAGLKIVVNAILYQTALEKGLCPEEAAKISRKTYKEFSSWLRKEVLKMPYLPKEFLEKVKEKIETTTRFTEGEKEELLKSIADRMGAFE